MMVAQISPTGNSHKSNTTFQTSKNCQMKYILTVYLAFFLTGGFWLVIHAGAATTNQPPLPYRIVSFHQGKANIELIKLAKEAGYNGVQIQTEYGTLKPLQEFAEYNQRTQLI
jgi:hypothetical protein